MIDSGKKITSFVVGVLILALGIIPLLNKFNVLAFQIPMMELMIKIAFWVFAAGGVFILIDAHLEDHAMKIPSTIIGILLIAVGLIEILFSFGTIGFHIPFLSDMIFYVLFVIEGLFLVIGGFAV